MYGKTSVAILAGIAALTTAAPAAAEGWAIDRAADLNEFKAQTAPIAIAFRPAVVRQARSNGPMLSDAELGEQRGGEALVVTNQTLTAITQGNVLNGDFAAGDVSLSDNAFSNFNGIGNIVINTGAQVSLQSGMNLTINVN
jgi:hypothetical protein